MRRFEPLSAKQRFVLALAGLGVLGLGLAGTSTAQQAVPATPTAAQGQLLLGQKNVHVIDMTPTNQIFPRYHLIYNFDKNTATLTAIDESGVQVRSITRLDQVDKAFAPNPK